MALLADAGHRVVLVVATSGELGVPEPGVTSLGASRQAETLECCRALGVDDKDVVFLGFADSGLHAENPDGFCHRGTDVAAHALCDAVTDRVGDRIDAFVTYDDHGIYGHPDHIQVHLATLAAAERLGVETVYEVSVDREYLHFVETHVVVEAGLGRTTCRPRTRRQRSRASVAADRHDGRRLLGPRPQASGYGGAREPTSGRRARVRVGRSKFCSRLRLRVVHATRPGKCDRRPAACLMPANAARGPLPTVARA